MPDIVLSTDCEQNKKLVFKNFIVQLPWRDRGGRIKGNEVGRFAGGW